jgi:hypothetical protein
VATLRAWLKAYRHGGLDALLPKTRTDKGTFRCIHEDTAEEIARHRVQHRALSVKLYHEILHQDAVLPDCSAPGALLQYDRPILDESTDAL